MSGRPGSTVCSVWDARMLTVPKETLRGIGVYPNGLPRFATNFAMSKDIDAMALPRGIYFRKGKYDPFSAAGIALIGHELVHEKQWEKYGPTGFLIRYGFTQNNNLETRAYEFQAWLENEINRTLKKGKSLPCKR